MSAIINEIGNQYGTLTVLCRHGQDKWKAALWKCRCQCGKTNIATGHDLRRGNTKSCSHSCYMNDRFVNNKEVLDGHLLGDGHIRLDPKNNPRLCIVQSTRQLGFVEYLKERLCPTAKIHSCRNVYYTNCRSSQLFPYYKRWYPNTTRKEIVPFDFEVTPISMLVAFMGDGSTSWFNKNLHSVILRLSTNCFRLNDLEFLNSKIKKKIGFEFRFDKIKNGYCMTTSRKNNVQNFLDYLGPCPVPCMSYKWKHPIFTGHFNE